MSVDSPLTEAYRMAWRAPGAAAAKARAAPRGSAAAPLGGAALIQYGRIRQCIAGTPGQRLRRL